MRILQVNTQDQRGGAAEIAMSLHNAFRRKGHDAWMAVGFKQGKDDHVIEVPNQQFRSAYTRLLDRKAENLWHAEGKVPAAWRMSRTLSWLANPIRRWSVSRGREDFDFPATSSIPELIGDAPDIIHCHNLHGGYFDLRVLPTMSQRYRMVVTMHDSWLLSGHCAHSMECERWKTGCGSCPYPDLYPAMKRDASDWNWRHKRSLYNQSRLFVVTPCQWLMGKLEASILAEGTTGAKVIPNGVDLSVFGFGDQMSARRKLGIPEGAHVLLFAADGIRNNPWKDFATMRAAVDRIGHSNLKNQVWFVALGEESSDERVGNSVIHFVPHQPDTHMVAEYYRAADVYLHAAKADTFPTTVLESLACGTPVVATAVGGITEQVDNGETGFLVEKNQADLMAEKVKLLLQADELAARMRYACRKKAEECFSQDLMVERYLKWYEEILNNDIEGKGQP